MIVYLSGPISKDPDYAEKFRKAEKDLAVLGYTVLNPAKLSDTFPGLTEGNYMDLAITLLRMSDAVYMMDGYEQSLGARAEWTLAKKHGKKLIYQSVDRLENLSRKASSSGVEGIRDLMKALIELKEAMSDG